MEDRFEMSFRNKELRAWFVIMLPAFIISLPFLFFSGEWGIQLATVPPLLGWAVYYVWRSIYRKKQKSAV